MKTLIINGSPRTNGDTATLIALLVSELKGEVKVVDSYKANVKACIDCSYCWKNSGCSIKDGMQEIYDYIQECDNVVIASPIFFTELSGSLLALSSRLQTYFCARFMRKEIPVPKAKRGGILLAEGGTGSLDKALNTASVLLETMNAKDIGVAVCCKNTDHEKPDANLQVMEEIRKLASFFNH